MKKYLIALALVGLTTTSCYEKLNIAPPNAITDEQVKALLASADEATITTIMGGLAGGLPDEIIKNNSKGGALEYRYGSYFGMLPMRSFEGNDMVFGEQVTAQGFGHDEYALVDFRSSNSTRNYLYWEQGWMWVTDANKVLKVVDDATVGNNATLKMYQAWALFVRAYAYNWLLENYQQAYMQGGSTKLGVPYYGKYDPSQPYQARATLKACYDSINKDVDKAIANLTVNGDGFTADKSDIDAGVLYFLKARVALATGEWSAAIAACDKIIAKYGTTFMSEKQYVAQPDYPEGATGKVQYYAINSGFLTLAQNPECLYGWDLNKTKDKVFEVYFFNTYGCCSGGSGGNYARIDNRLYEKIADGDYRKDNFMLTPPATEYAYANGTNTRIQPYANLKFACTVGTGGGTDITPKTITATSYYTDLTLMRLSEVYLMKAEAEAQSGGDPTNTLNVLLAARTKTGAATLTCANYPSMQTMSNLEKVQFQTRLEMWGENGLEFYNNKRWNLPVDRTTSNVHWIKATQLTVPNMTLQIPEESTNFNPLLVQDN